MRRGLVCVYVCKYAWPRGCVYAHDMLVMVGWGSLVCTYAYRWDWLLMGLAESCEMGSGIAGMCVFEYTCLLSGHYLP